jgi:hypothetical protein
MLFRSRIRLPHLLAAWTVGTCVTITLAAPAPAQAAPVATGEKRTVLKWDSALKDEDNKPVSGLFPMQFQLRKPKQKKAFWKETHWVAVDNGRYALELGRVTPLPKNLDPKSSILTVNIPGVGEIITEALDGSDASLAEVADLGAGNRRIVQYAEKAGFAYEAERSGIADRLGDFTAEKLREALDALEKRKVKVRVGRNQVNLQSVGGAGGTPYEAVCPPGMVSIGIRGGSGIYIDNFQVVCAPLE